jgi:BirA family transcriptional regulator, biotin operon repressor / biotin---[acetyl-CoA-carboxylase] ligase
MIKKELVKTVEQIDSTNTYIKKNFATLEHGFLIRANIQTAGRGQRERVWESKGHENLLFSFLIKDNTISSTQLLMSTALTLKKILDDLNIYASIKLPNDVYVGKFKIAGILIENILLKDQAYKIVGVGLNVNEDLSSKDFLATSLKTLTKKNYKVEHILTAFIDHFNRLVQTDCFDTFRNYVLESKTNIKYNGLAYELIDFSKDFTCTINGEGTSKNIHCSNLNFDRN